MMLGGGMFLGLIFLILLIVVIVGLVAGGIRLAGRGDLGNVLNSSRRTEPSPGDEPLEILRRRYARGEISREEYEAIRQDLMD